MPDTNKSHKRNQWMNLLTLECLALTRCLEWVKVLRFDHLSWLIDSWDAVKITKPWNYINEHVISLIVLLTPLLNLVILEIFSKLEKLLLFSEPNSIISSPAFSPCMKNECVTFLKFLKTDKSGRNKEILYYIYSLKHLGRI